MKKVNWEEVGEATSVEWLEPGGYVVDITAVEDRPDWECLQITFDVAEGEQAHKFAGLAPDMNWSHQFRQSYSDKAQRFFKGFLTSLEKSNPNFHVAEWQKQSDESQFVGLKVGVILNYYHYINEKGLLVKKYNCARVVSADRIRSGDFTVPDDRWSDEAKAYEDSAASSESSTSSDGKRGGLYSDCPF